MKGMYVVLAWLVTFAQTLCCVERGEERRGELKFLLFCIPNVIAAQAYTTSNTQTIYDDVKRLLQYLCSQPTQRHCRAQA